MPKQLLSGERLVLPPLRRHWVLVAHSVVPAAVVTAVFLVLVDVVGSGVIGGDLRLLASATILAVLVLRVLTVWLRWEGDSLTITDQRVLLEEGVFQRTSRVIPLNRVQDVSTSQTLLGRLLGYGTVEIDAAGPGGAERFAYVGRPQAVRDQVFALLDRRPGRESTA
jgi:uncharacterized membrane protein YdbT with pleckstrin-like domain